MLSEVLIDGRAVGPGHSCYLVAEVGTTCLGKLDRAVALIDAAVRAGVDAIKFQLIDPDQISDPTSTYAVRVDGVENQVNMKEMFEKLQFPESDWAIIAQACRSKGLGFFATVDYIGGVDMLERLGVPVHKIGAWDCTFQPLIEHIGATAKPMFVDLGPATPAEIDDIGAWYQAAGGTAVLFMHDFHTADDRQMNLRSIQYLNETFPWPAGFSSPARDDDLDFAALALGASYIEKRLILSRSDFAFHAHESLEPNELKKWVSRIRHVERALGNPAITPSDKDREMSAAYYRSVCTLRPIKSGEILTVDNLGAKRPGTGIPTSQLKQIWGRKAAQDLSVDVLLTRQDFT
jgi:N,N'-diacetyllegionaminate synthase